MRVEEELTWQNTRLATDVLLGFFVSDWADLFSDLCLSLQGVTQRLG